MHPRFSYFCHQLDQNLARPAVNLKTDRKVFIKAIPSLPHAQASRGKNLVPPLPPPEMNGFGARMAESEDFCRSCLRKAPLN
jgi:hypothetical protein